MLSIKKIFTTFAGIGLLLFPLSLYGAAKADLRLTKSASAAIVNQAASMSYSLTLTNLSNSTNAQGITITDTLPSGMGYQSSSGSGWNCSTTGTPVTVTCTLAELAKSTSTVLTLNVTAPTSTVNGTVTFTNSATVATTGTDDDFPTNNTGSVSVTLNRPPIAVNDNVSTASHTTVTGNVLSNDADLDNDPLNVLNAGNHTLAFGSIFIDSLGNYTYTPGYFTGETEYFTYTVSDGKGGTATATLIVNIGSECTTTGISKTGPDLCLRKQTVLFGDMKTIGNTLVVPPNPQPAGLPSSTAKSVLDQTTYCSSYTTGPYYSDMVNTDNQSLFLCSYRPDGYLNATSAELDVPAGSTIKWAGLYLQSVVQEGDSANLLSMDVKIKKDSGSYYNTGTPTVVYYADYVAANGKNYDNYSAFIDITNLFKANSWTSGNYTIANVPVTTDTLQGAANIIGKYGAWSLVVIYENSDETLRSVSVYDGWRKINSTTPVPVTVDNFYTPTSGDIDAKVSIFVAEGDKYRYDDNFKNGIISLGTFDNAFDSSISGSSRFPLLSNNQGIDIKTYDIGTSGLGLLNNGDSNITFSLSTDFPSFDNYYASMLAFSTEVYHPKMCYYEDIYGTSGKLSTGAQIQKGSPLHVKVLLKNDQLEPAEKVLLYRTFDTSMPYTPNSTGYNPSPTDISSTTTLKTDSLDGDIFDYSSPLSLFSLHAGTGATYNQGGDFSPNQEALFDYNTTANFDGNRSITYQIAYTMPTIGFRYEGELAKCVDFNNTFGVIPSVSYPVGNMDVIETSYYNTAGNYAAANKNILTKIVKKPFNVEAVYVDENGIEKVYNGEIGNNKIIHMGVMLYTTDTDTCTEERQLIWRGQLLHGNSHVTAVVDDVDVDNADEEQGFTIIKAHKDQRIKANFIDYGTLINAATDLTCSVSSLDSSLCLVPACLNSDTQILKAFPPDIYEHVTICLYGDGTGTNAPCDSSAYNGSCGGKKSNIIGPIKYNNDIGCAMCLADALGMNGCSTDNFATRPNDFNSTIAPNQQFVADQNVTLTFRADPFGATTGALDYNETEHSSFVVDVNISDSTKTCAQPSISFSPDINFTNGTVTANYTLPNVGDFNVTMHEISGSEFALVDVDDTSDTDRLITPHQIQIKVIPDHFLVEGNLTNGSNGFTYLSNFETYPTVQSRNISAILDLNVTAKSTLDNNLSNYTAACYAKDGNVTMTMASAINITPVGSLSKLLWYDTNHDLNGSIPIAGNTYSLGMYATQFDSTDSNGTANMNYRINFDRNQTLLVNPFDVVADSVAADDNDSVNGSLPLNSIVTYTYGRLIPRDIRVFGDSVNGVASAWYEVYNEPIVNGTNLQRSRNENLWFINSLHNDIGGDGDGYVTQWQNGTNPSTTVTPPAGNAAINGVETYNFGTNAIGGYKAHIDTDPWLWYGINALLYVDPATGNTEADCLRHPCFNVTVVPAVGATGSAKGGSEGVKGNKKSDQDTAAPWQSHGDYAPAIK